MTYYSQVTTRTMTYIFIVCFFAVSFALQIVNKTIKSLEICHQQHLVCLEKIARNYHLQSDNPMTNISFDDYHQYEPVTTALVSTAQELKPYESRWIWILPVLGVCLLLALIYLVRLLKVEGFICHQNRLEETSSPCLNEPLQQGTINEDDQSQVEHIAMQFSTAVCFSISFHRHRY